MCYKGNDNLVLIGCMMNIRTFKDILCVTALLFVQGGAFGMEKTMDPAHEIGEIVTITDRSQLLSITPEQAKKIKSLRIENQVIDDEAYNAVAEFAADPEPVYFVNCSFSKIGEWVLGEFPSVSRVGFIRCNLSYDALEKLLHSNNPHNDLEVLDLTGNDLGKDPERFVAILKSSVYRVKKIEELILVDNGFDAGVVSLIKAALGWFIGRIYL